VHETVARVRFAAQVVKKLTAACCGALLEKLRLKNAHETVVRAWFQFSQKTF